MKKTFSISALLSLLLFLSVSFLVHAQQTYHVSTTGQDVASRDGLSSATAWRSIAYAFGQVPAGNNTIQLGAGTFVVSQAAALKNGWTLNGQGHTGSNITTIINASTFGPDGAICLPYSQEKSDFPLQNYLLGGDGLKDVTISNLVLTSRLDTPLDGAIMMKYARNLTLFNLTVREFRWNGIYLREGKQVNIHHCLFKDASYTRLCNTWGGGLRTRYMKDFELSHCAFKTTKGGGYGYKASGHENAKIHDNIFHNKVTLDSTSGRPFDLESAHEFEWGLEIYNNVFNGMVSVPRSGEQKHPSDRGDYTYTVRIHDNVFYGSGGVEGPRNYLEIDHNYFAQKWGNNGRVFEIHGGKNAGPTTIHHNVAECSMGFVFKKGDLNENISILNNTVYLVNSDRNNFPTSFLEVGGAVSNWQVKNNVVFADDAQSPDKPSAFSRGSLPATGITMSKNVAWKVVNIPPGASKADPQLARSGAKPKAYYAAQGASSYVVDRGTNVGFPFEGTAPDIGTYERKSSAASGVVSGIVRLKNRHSGSYLRYHESVLYMEPNIEQNWSTVKWNLEDAGSGRVRLKNVNSGKYLRHKNGILYLEKNIASSWTTVRWILEEAGDGYVRLKNLYTGHYLRHKEGTLYMEANIQQDWTTVRWKLEQTGDNAARSISKVSDELLDKTTIAKNPESLPTETNTLALYPNPASDQLQVAFSDASALQLLIRDLQGRTVLQQTLPRSQTVNVGHLPAGLYTVQLLSKQQTVLTQKLVIE